MRAAVRVQRDRLVMRLALPERHQHGLEYEIPGLTGAHRPADLGLVIEVDDDAQV